MHPVGAVMVPGDEERGNLQAQDQLLQHPPQEAHGVGGGKGPVVEVPGHDDSIGPGLPGQGDELLQDVFLVLEKRGLVEGPSQVPVGGVEEAHG